MDPWRIGVRMRYWRKRRGLTIGTLGDLVGRSSSWVQMAETGRRAPYNLRDLANLAAALRVDLGAFLCDAVPGVPDSNQQQVLQTLRAAFSGGDPRAGLARVAHRLSAAEAEGDLMIMVLPGGQWTVASRRDALKLGATLGISLAAPALSEEQAGELATSLSTREIGSAGVEALESVVNAYRRLDDEIGSAALRTLVAHQLRLLAGVHAKSGNVRTRLGSVAAEFQQLAAWLAFDTDDHDAARAHYRAGLRLAEGSGDEGLAAHVLGWMSYLESASGSPSEGACIAEAALRRARNAGSPRLRASLARMHAHAHARGGDVHGCEAALGQAELELSGTDPTDSPRFAYWFDESVLHAHAGIANVLLERPSRARPALERSLEMLGPTCVRDRALHLSWLAVSLVQADEIAEACRVAAQAADLLDQARSERTSVLLKELHAGRLRSHWHSPAVRELGDRLYAL